MMKPTSVCLLLWSTSGCAVAPALSLPAEQSRPGLEGSCRPEAIQGLVALNKSPKTEAEAIRLSGAATVRWIQPGDAVAMDYQTDRINLETDRRNRVIRAYCG